jgi:lambda family phage portal protein
MTELVPSHGSAGLDPALIVANAGLAPGHGWGSRPNLTSSDRVVMRNKDSFAADAQDASRVNPFAKSALRTIVDSVIGDRFTLELEPSAELLGVTDDAVDEWSSHVEALWEAAATSTFYPMDAQRKQTWSGLMRTAYAVYFTSGEALGTVEWKPSPASTGQATCLHLIAPERLSDPRGVMEVGSPRRMGVERDNQGAPIAYHIREQHPSDEGMWGRSPTNFTWRRVPRYTYWGRQNVLHFFEHDQADMTRGISSFTTALQPMRLLQDYLITELESASIRATYAAVIESKLDYEDAMRVVGEDHNAALSSNPVHEFTMKMMAEKAKFYNGQEFRFGKSKVAHLLPDEALKMVQGTQSASAMKDFASVNAYMLSSALGVDYTSLTKDFSSTNYSGARAALYDVWRSYEVRRKAFIDGFAWPFFLQWLEEMIVFKGIIPMLGTKSFYEVRDFLAIGTFSTWNKPRLDPMKEAQADIALYHVGAKTLKDLCAADGTDWRKNLKQRKREKDEMKSLGLTPEDIDPGLKMNAGKDAKGNAKGEGTGSEGGSSTGTSD